MTVGELMFYGGIVACVCSAVLAIVSWTVYEKKKHTLLQEIEREYRE